MRSADDDTQSHIPVHIHTHVHVYSKRAYIHIISIDTEHIVMLRVDTMCTLHSYNVMYGK